MASGYQIFISSHELSVLYWWALWIIGSILNQTGHRVPQTQDPDSFPPRTPGTATTQPGGWFPHFRFYTTMRYWVGGCSLLSQWFLYLREHIPNSSDIHGSGHLHAHAARRTHARLPSPGLDFPALPAWPHQVPMHAGHPPSWLSQHTRYMDLPGSSIRFLLQLLTVVYFLNVLHDCVVQFSWLSWVCICTFVCTHTVGILHTVHVSDSVIWYAAHMVYATCTPFHVRAHAIYTLRLTWWTGPPPPHTLPYTHTHPPTPPPTPHTTHPPAAPPTPPPPPHPPHLPRVFLAGSWLWDVVYRCCFSADDKRCRCVRSTACRAYTQRARRCRYAPSFAGRTGRGGTA